MSAALVDGAFRGRTSAHQPGDVDLARIDLSGRAGVTPSRGTFSQQKELHSLVEGLLSNFPLRAYHHVSMPKPHCLLSLRC